MTRSRTPAKQADSPVLRLLAPVTVVAVAAALSAFAWISMVRLWERLPAGQGRAVEAFFASKRGLEVRDAIVAKAGPRYAQASFLAQISQEFPQAAVARATRQQARQTLAANLANVSDTALGRVQMVLLLLLEAEATDLPPDAAWEGIRAYLEGLGAATFAHFEDARLATIAEIFRAAGASPGAAAEYAAAEVPGAHGAFVQLLIPRLRQTAEQRAASGDADGAALCRSVARRLLREWIVTDGPAATRLVAAHLLATLLRAAPDVPAAAGMADDLNAWRQRYRDAAERTPPSLFGAGSRPTPAAAEHEALYRWTVFAIALGGAAVGAAAAALAAGWSVFTTAGAVVSRSHWIGGGAALACGLAAGLALLTIFGGACREDVRRLFNDRAGPPRIPIYMAAGAALLLLASALLPPAAARNAGVAAMHGRAGSKRAGAGGWVRRVSSAGALSIVAWLVLAAASVAATFGAHAAASRHDSAYAAAMQDEYAAFAGDQAALLQRVRAWQP